MGGTYIYCTPDHYECYGVYFSPLPPLLSIKDTREPLPPVDMNEIWEACRDDGVLLGKGGFYGNVSAGGL